MLQVALVEAGVVVGLNIVIAVPREAVTRCRRGSVARCSREAVPRVAFLLLVLPIVARGCGESLILGIQHDCCVGLRSKDEDAEGKESHSNVGHEAPMTCHKMFTVYNGNG